MPKEWQTGEVVPLFQKGHKRVCQLQGYHTTKPPWMEVMFVMVVVVGVVKLVLEDGGGGEV